MWSGLWFLTNMVFVACIIAYLFAHRSVSEARRMDTPVDRIRTLSRRRMALGVASVVMFFVMAGCFMINMRLNG
ncbi:conserved hypothetical protein [Paenibacillus curdlanolyticus YK9]|uniref:Uncharacterized protein n=1 Tax=Paenibacillus curdlanolyticus YK9 TaxID=717606 RepID=E0ICM3_9BACL|nr:hypothetical protein [Paenibacillus curdlanolyticus]EFM09909.1 conserved hypothetical protein [Paenibacillus curdlanolyticus YK9]